MSTGGLECRSNTTTFVPSSSKRFTMAAPMPAAPPVTMAVLPFKPRIARSCALLGRDDGGGLELDLTGRVEEVRDEDHAHRRVVAAHEPLPDRPQLGARRQVGRLVAAVRSHAADVLRPAARLGEDGKDVLQSLFKLGNDF